jgi:hypothetical protein
VGGDSELMAISSSGKLPNRPPTGGIILWSPTRPEVFFARREIKQLVILSLAYALVFLYPLLCDSRLSGPGVGAWLFRPQLQHFYAVPSDGADRDMFTQLRWVPYYTLAHFHQLPFWNPYKCGGMPMLGNPESGIVTPFLLFYLIFGLIPGMLLEIYLHVAILFAGGYVLGRELGLVPLAALVLAAMFPSSSWLSLHVALGHLNFLSTAYLPWIVALLLASCRMRRWHPAILGGLLCGLTLTEGNYAFVFAAMIVALAAVWFAMVQLSIRPLLAAAVIGIFALAFSLPKLVPTSELLTIHPRDWGMSYLTWRGILISLFDRNQDLNHPLVASFFFSEYAGYIGAPFLLLALIGIFADTRKSLPWLFGVICFFSLYRGDASADAPTMFLRQLPLGGNIGLCGRWVIPMLFCVGVLAALGAQSLCDQPRQWRRRLAGVLLVVGLADAWYVCAPDYRYLFQGARPSPPPSKVFRQYYGGFVVPLTSIAMAGLGSTNCGGVGYQVPRGGVLGYNEKGYRGEYWLLGAGTVTETQWTPNRISYDIDAHEPTSLVVNQTMYPGWHLARGDGSVYAENGLIGVRVPSGRQEIDLAYTPRHLRAACEIALFALAALIIVWWLEARTAPASRDPRVVR